MTPEELAKMRERAEAATPGPWVQDGGSISAPNNHGQDVVDWVYADKDWPFIAHARMDIPALLDHVAALEAENAALKELRGLVESMVGLDPDNDYHAVCDAIHYAEEWLKQHPTADPQD